MWVFQDGAALSRELTTPVDEASCLDGLQAPSLSPRLVGGSGPPRLLVLSGTRAQHILGCPAPCQEPKLRDICHLDRPLRQPQHPALSPRPTPCFMAHLWENMDFLKISGNSPLSHLRSGFFLAPGTLRMGLGSKDLKFHVYTSLLHLGKEIPSRCLPLLRTGPLKRTLETLPPLFHGLMLRQV